MEKDRNFLEVIPTIVHNEYKEVDGVIHIIFTHDELIQKVLRWFTRKGRTSTLELDRLGSKAWKSFNGKNTFYDIVNILMEEEEDTYESMEQRIIIFARYMHNKKLITFNDNK